MDDMRVKIAREMRRIKHCRKLECLTWRERERGFKTIDEFARWLRR